MKKLILVLVLLSAAGCVSIPAEDVAFYNEMIAAGECPCTWPAPWVAGLMSVLPAGGQFYNAQFGQATINFALWPLSYFWAIPTAIINANRINMRRSVAYWRYRQTMRKE
jgi:hypothetical protein